MFSEATTLRELRDRIDMWIEIMGGEARVGMQDGEYLDAVMMEWVCINSRTQKLVGTEADDYERRLKPGEGNAVRLTIL